MAIRFPRLEQLLGTQVAQLKSADIDRLVASKVREDQDLEFKRGLYENTKDLAIDVAAMANGIGGLILLGVNAVNGEANEAIPISLTDEEEVRIHQIIADRCAPPPIVEVHRIPGNEEGVMGFLALLIPASPLRPHAARSDNSLKYPQRDGPRNRYLSEHEVAEAYRRRFSNSSERDERLKSVRTDGIAKLDIAKVWLCLTLVPGVPGRMEIDRRTVGDARLWALGHNRPYLGWQTWRGGVVESSVGVRRITISSDLNDHPEGMQWNYAELHSDGSAFIATPISRPKLDEQSENYVLDQDLMERMVSLVRFLVDQPIRCGCAGAATARADIVGAFPIELWRDWQGFPDRVSGSRQLTRPVSSSHSISPQAISAEPREHLYAARHLLADLLQAFGVPETIYISADGELRKQAIKFYGSWDTWAGAFPITEEPL